MQQELARPPAAPGRSPFQRSLERRRRTVAALLLTAVVAFVVAILASRPLFWAVHVIADVALAVYVGVLIHVRNASADDEMTHLGSGVDRRVPTAPGSPEEGFGSPT